MSDVVIALVTVVVLVAYAVGLNLILHRDPGPEPERLRVGHVYCCLQDERMRDLGAAPGYGPAAGTPVP